MTMHQKKLGTPLLICLMLAIAACGTAAGPQRSSAVHTPTAEPTAAFAATPALMATSTARPDLSTAAATLDPDEVAATIDGFLTTLTKDDLYSGSVLVARGGKVILSKGYGWADRDRKVRNTPRTKFRLASVTKQFTAMGILILQHRGKLHVRDRICGYVPKCPKTWQRITIRHLLTHTSGIPDITVLPDFYERKSKPATPSELIAWMRNEPMEFEPGERFEYSNSGYIVLGYIIEQASGASYADFLRENIFRPLDMRDSGYNIHDPKVKQKATGYGSGYRDAEPVDMTMSYAAGGLYSSVEDLYRWDRGLYTEQLVPRALLREMFTPHAKPAEEPEGEGYGYGWVIQEDYGRTIIHHTGGMEGGRTRISRYPQDGVVIILLSNYERVALDDVHRRIAEALFEGR